MCCHVAHQTTVCYHVAHQTRAAKAHGKAKSVYMAVASPRCIAISSAITVWPCACVCPAERTRAKVSCKICKKHRPPVNLVEVFNEQYDRAPVAKPSPVQGGHKVFVRQVGQGHRDLWSWNVLTTVVNLGQTDPLKVQKLGQFCILSLISHPFIEV